MPDTTNTTSLDSLSLPEAFFRSYDPDQRRNSTLSAEDQLEIMGLVYRFELANDSRRFDALANILTDDMVVDHIWGYRQGKQAVLDLLKEHAPETPGYRHQATNVVLFPNDDGSVTALSFLFVVATVSSPPGQLSIGHAVVTDVARRVDGVWKIARRTFEQMALLGASVPDEATRAYLALTAQARAAERHHE